MALKDYYIILGISPTAGSEGIRCAFRQLAKKFHPDKAGSERTSYFQDITEAYEVLSNPEKRKIYNQKLTEEKKRQKCKPENIPAQPVVTEYDPDVLEMDAFLTDQEAYTGLTIKLRLSIAAQCIKCGGSGHDFFFMCNRCNGSGFTTLERPIRIHLPPGLKNGDIIKTSIALSEENYLQFLLRIYII